MPQPEPLLTIRALGHRITVVLNTAGAPCYDVDCSCNAFGGAYWRTLTDAADVAFGHVRDLTHPVQPSPL